MVVRLRSIVLRNRPLRSGTMTLMGPLARVSTDSCRRVAAPSFSGASSARWRSRKDPNSTSQDARRFGWYSVTVAVPSTMRRPWRRTTWAVVPTCTGPGDVCFISSRSGSHRSGGGERAGQPRQDRQVGVELDPLDPADPQG
jgi:hypothetical protein